MKLVITRFVLIAVIAFTSVLGPATSQPQQTKLESADRLFRAGKFAEAGKLYMRMADRDPKDYSAVVQLGCLALLANRLDEAQKRLEQAIALQPGDADTKVMLAEVFYRRDDFQKAVAALNGVDVSSSKLLVAQYPTLNVAKLASFEGQTPYDTGGSEIALDTDFARELGVPQFGAVQGTFSGRQRSAPAPPGRARV